MEGKLFLKKVLTNKRESIVKYVTDMQTAFKEIGKSKGAWSVAAITKLLSLICYYSIPFFGFLAININMGWDNFFYVCAVTSFALTLAIGVIVSMFSAITVTRNFMHLLFDGERFKSPKYFRVKESEIVKGFEAEDHD